MRGNSRPTGLHRGAVAGSLGLVSLALAPAIDWPIGALTCLSVGLPAGAWFLSDRLPMRGVAAIGAAVILGSAILAVAPTPSGVAWGDLAVLGLMVPVAMLGTRFAAAMRQPTPALELDPCDGRWMTVVVSTEGPAPGVGRHAVLPTLPRNDPERRRLSRRVERRRELVTGGPHR